MIKVKLLPYSLSLSWEELRAILDNARYTEKEARGIKINDYSKREIKATFYEKIIYTETIDDPINGMIELKRQTFFSTSFILYHNIIIIINPSRRMPSLITHMLSKTDFKLIVNDSKLDLTSTANILGSLLENFTPIKMSFNQFNITEELKCTMSLVSSKDIKEEIKSIGIDLPKIPNKLTFTGFFLGKATRGEINDNGTISISHPKYQIILDKITACPQKIFA